MKLRTTLLAATMIAAPLAAKAQPISGLYIGAGVGYNLMQDEPVRSSPGLGTPKLHARFDGGEVGLGSIGWGFGNGLRLEVEGDYRRNNLHELSGTSFPAESGGFQQTYGAMVNALFDMDIGLPWIYPYIGAGAGYAWTDWHGIYASGTNTPELIQAHGTFGNFAYQGIIGAAFPIAPVPGLSLTAEYRFYGILGPGKFSGQVESDNGSFASGHMDITENLNHSFLLGVRYAFNAAPPPPPPAPAPVAAPAPAPARTYLVFFDWDKATLTDRARQIIQEAAQASTHVQYTRIAVNGYTDTSGTARYNMGLSIRRAQAVAAELVRDGVPRNVIDIKGFGETHPLVPTGPGVREPQNRRVEIILQ